MQRYSDDELLDLWSRIFQRRGHATANTQLLPDVRSVRGSLFEGNGVDSERLVLVSESRSGTMALTTRRVMWDVAGSRHEVQLVDIAGVRPSGFGAKPKLELDALDLTLVNGVIATIPIESGGPLVGLHSVIINVVARNRAAPI